MFGLSRVKSQNIILLLSNACRPSHSTPGRTRWSRRIYASWRRMTSKIQFGDLVGFLSQSKDLFFYVILYHLIMRVQVRPYKIVCHSFHGWISWFLRVDATDCGSCHGFQLPLVWSVAACSARQTMFHTAEPNGMRGALVCFVPQDKHNDILSMHIHLQLKRANDPFQLWQKCFSSHHKSRILWKIVNSPSFFSPDGEAPVRHFAFVLRLGLPGHGLGHSS